MIYRVIKQEDISDIDSFLQRDYKHVLETVELVIVNGLLVLFLLLLLLVGDIF